MPPYFLKVSFRIFEFSNHSKNQIEQKQQKRIMDCNCCDKICDWELHGAYIVKLLNKVNCIGKYNRKKAMELFYIYCKYGYIVKKRKIPQCVVKGIEIFSSKKYC